MEESWPTNAMMVNLDAIKGQSLEKMCLEKETSSMRVYLVRKPTLNELQGNCDQCAKQHRPTNTTCSMWLKRETYAQDFGKLYNPKTRTELKGWVLVSVDTKRHSRISRETYVRG